MIHLKNLSKLICMHICYIYAEIFKRNHTSEICDYITVIETISNIGLSTLVKLQFQGICNRLLLMISSNKEQVFNGLNVLKHCQADDKMANHQITADFTEKDLSEFLGPRFLGVLAFFDSYLSADSISLAEKLSILRSLDFLLTVVSEKSLTALRVKILTILRGQINHGDENFNLLALKCFQTIHSRLNESSVLTSYHQFVSFLCVLVKNDTPDSKSALLKILNSFSTNENILSCLFFVPFSQLKFLSTYHSNMLKTLQTSNSACESFELITLNGFLNSWDEKDEDSQIFLLQEIINYFKINSVLEIIEKNKELIPALSQLLLKVIVFFYWVVLSKFLTQSNISNYFLIFIRINN